MKSYATVTTKKELQRWVDACAAAKLFAFDTETTGLNIVGGMDHAVGFSLAYENDDREISSCYVPIRHATGEAQLAPNVAFDMIAPLLADKTIPKVMHNGGFDINVMAKEGVTINNIEDTQLMSYALDGQKYRARGHNMDSLAKYHFGYETVRFNDVVNSELGIPNFAHVRLDHATHYAAEDTDVTLQFYFHIRKMLEEAGTDFVYDFIDKPIVPILASMKRHGVRIDRERLAQLDDQWSREISAIEDQVYEMAGREVNLGSNKQLGQYLYGKKSEGGLELEPPSETDGGAWSTDKEALAELANDHPVVPLIQKRGELAKLVSTYTHGWVDKISKDGFLHADFMATTTNTGRLSAKDGLHQVPARTENGKELRYCVVAGEGNEFACNDASQVEYRILAQATGQPYMVQAFNEGMDFHAAMAARVLGGNWKDYADKSNAELYAERSKFKNVNFATIYGAGVRKIAAMCGIGEKEAYRLLDEYYGLFPEVTAWKENVIEFGKKHGYVETLFGRRIQVPHIQMRGNKALVAYGERQAVNGVVQGTAADLNRLAMIETDKVLRKFKGAKLLLSVHDEFVTEARKQIIEDVAYAVKRAIETCTSDLIDWAVPIISEKGHGPSWGAAK